MADVAYLVRDMLFTSKIREVAKQRGWSVASAADPAALAAAAQSARVVIVDLRLPQALDALAVLKGVSPSGRLIGFVDHERVDVMTAARELGATVLTKGQFAKELPALLSTP